MASDMGDYQTPPALVAQIFACLSRRGKAWSRMLEPTCGHGAFIQGALALNAPPREIIGIEIQEHYVTQARALGERGSVSRISIQQASILKPQTIKQVRWRDDGPLLVVGNPPWVTNAALSSLGSANAPAKRNLKALRGIEAMTGASNFDLAEYIWLELIQALTHERPTIALLCKTQVARNVLLHASKQRLPISTATIHRIDARRWFQVAVDACLFTLEVGAPQSDCTASVFADLTSEMPSAVIGIADGRLTANVATRSYLAELDGASPLTWRQGVKHDAASVVELSVTTSGTLCNKLGQIVQVEQEYIYPLLKSSDLAHREGSRPMTLQRALIVPQTRIGQQTRLLAGAAPRLWAYLTEHEQAFQRRKSSIYRNQPSFAYFGVGEYTFAPYKVAVSGMYKMPAFRAIGPRQGRSVLLDDTCYFLACSSSRQAALVASLLNDPLCLRFLDTITFWDSKRPITKKVLQRIDLLALLERVDRAPLLLRATAELERLDEAEAQRREWPAALAPLLLPPDDARLSDIEQLTLLTL